MKKTAIVLALMMGSAAIAQTTTEMDTNSDAGVVFDTATPPTGLDSPDATTSAPTAADQPLPAPDTLDQSGPAPMASAAAPASGPVVQPGNQNPERDARGISVISAEATVPAGWNGIAAGAEGGPLLDPTTGEPVADGSSYPACSKTVTDNCLQAYERGRQG